ncbi:hypothetical protein KVT40_007469 [Elsinoe batatas]|uniref:F-box domain-containing protein n=1 Tax=Elsinoe batatas TaxID=2601811 RepID=A0A8K0KVP8_9PEZI|nr:hypothetical protein KVT40_007469 [Elsinoe batatas]
MDALPDELLIHILSYLEQHDLVHTQLLSKRLLKLGRDDKIWKERCFQQSPAENIRRKQRDHVEGNSHLSALRQAFTTLEDQSRARARGANTKEGTEPERNRYLTSWDPRYPGEELDYYQEYIHRHAPIAPVTWLDFPRDRINGTAWDHVATGIGMLRDVDGQVQQMVTPMDDGSIAMWTVDTRTDADTQAEVRLTTRSSSGLLTGLAEGMDRASVATDSKTIMTEVGAVECVSIDAMHKRGLFAVQQSLQEVDLNTMQVISSQAYPFAITALSEVCGSAPITVGTTSTVHIYDSRIAQAYQPSDDSIKTELIGGPTATHAVLTQPGPMSILHHQDDSIWVAGRFTHMLNYDRRFFPKLLGTIHSGARISSLAALPYPHISRDLDVLSNPDTTMASLKSAKSATGTTFVAAGVYKGKGSLELYGWSPSDSGASGLLSSKYQNRQTASTSKLLSAIPTGAHIVMSDSDGNVKWFERNAHHRIRTFNINETDQATTAPEYGMTTGAEIPSFNQASTQAQSDNIFGNPDMDAPGHGDIVQKLISFQTHSSSTSTQNPLFMWTGDGRVGVLSFGHRPAFVQRRTAADGYGSEEEEDEGYVSGYSGRGEKRSEEPSEEVEKMRVHARRAERRAREDAERQFAGRMRRALEGQAREVRWMRGLGLGD